MSLRSLMAIDHSFLDIAMLHRRTSECILNRMLSTKCYLSTEDQGNLAEEDRLETFKQVGKGQCGTVWRVPGTKYVVKVPNQGMTDELYNDCCMHKRIEEGFQGTPWALRKSINIPSFGRWVHPAHMIFWDDLNGVLPRGFQRTYGLLSERILPLPLPIREAIVDAFAPRSIRANKASFLAETENEDCLIRIYLGRRVQRSSSNTFRLRNFDLTVNEMEVLRLDTSMYARVMAQSLAILHWKVGVDANDVEFVLGRAPQVRMAPTAVEMRAADPDDAIFIENNIDLGQRSVGIWLLDFNQCQTFSEDSAGIKQLERGFFFNDPYYPRPGAADPKDNLLWEHFKGAYLNASASLVDKEMPLRFIDAVETEGRKRVTGGSIFQ